jgi:hypothetical protein
MDLNTQAFDRRMDHGLLCDFHCSIVQRSKLSRQKAFRILHLDESIVRITLTISTSTRLNGLQAFKKSITSSHSSNSSNAVGKYLTASIFCHWPHVLVGGNVKYMLLLVQYLICSVIKL